MKTRLPFPEEKVWKELTISGKIRYLWDYYKLPFVIALILLYIAGFSIKGYLTRTDPVLYTAMVNVAVSQELEQDLFDDFLMDMGVDPEKHPLQLYKNIYLTDNSSSEVFEYVYASQMKILGAIEAKELDVVFMDKEAFDAFAQNGFLYDLDLLLAESKNDHPGLSDIIAHDLVSNMEIKEDNAKEIALDPSVEYHSVTAEYAMGIDLSSSPFFQNSGFTESVYLGILNNTPRKENVLDYLEYLYQTKAPQLYAGLLSAFFILFVVLSVKNPASYVQAR